MFGFFRKNKKVELLISEEVRQWIDRALLWLTQEFDLEKIKSRPVLKPEAVDFPIDFNGSHQSAYDLIKILAPQMEVDPDLIILDIYTEGQSEINAGGVLGSRIFVQAVEGEKYSSGLYWGKQEDNKYHIGLEEKKLKEPSDMIATLAHEFSHIKLLGEQRIKKNNEHLTDLTTIIFGLGVFNANAAFQTKRGLDYWGWSKLGYLSQMEWGYALALFAFIREEENPEWVKHLSANIRSDFKKSAEFIRMNKEKIFASPIKEGNDE